MLEDLQMLKDEYMLKGGQNKDFMDKLGNLEGHLLYNRPLPTNTRTYGDSNVPADPQRNEISVS